MTFFLYCCHPSRIRWLGVLTDFDVREQEVRSPAQTGHRSGAIDEKLYWESFSYCGRSYCLPGANTRRRYQVPYSERESIRHPGSLLLEGTHRILAGAAFGLRSE